MRDLSRETGNKLILKFGIEIAAWRKLIPRVDPVLDAPRRNVARVTTNRHLPDPRLDQLLPNATILLIAAQRESVGKIQTVIKFVPLDAPLFVCGQRRGPPV